ncbi:MAG: alpha/beta hydrolase, partial [Pseudomonadota bacterium]
MIRWLRRLAMAFVLLYLLAFGALYAAQDVLLFPGWSGPPAASVASVPGMSEIAIPGPDGTTLRTWSRPADPGRPTILFFHGNAGFQWGKLPPLAARGYGLSLTAYRGFAGNPGDPSEAGLLDDARAALAHLAAAGIA